MQIAIALAALILLVPPVHAESPAMFQASCLPAEQAIERLKSKGLDPMFRGITRFDQLGQFWMSQDFRWAFTLRDQDDDICVVARGDDASLIVPEWSKGVKH